MSGIAGIHDHGVRNHVSDQDIAQMLRAMAHRGPDGATAWCEASIGLGHAHLRTTPGEDRQPLEDGNLCITADARLDNRDELLAGLGLNDRRISDAGLIAAAYRRWGAQSPERLLGDFAFAIWDIASRTLFCARDHFGVKPFYYRDDGQRLSFASEMKAILAVDTVERKLDDAWVGGYLNGLVDDCERTPYAGILRLPPGHSLHFTGGRAQISRYWELCPEPAPERDDAAEEFFYLFQESIRVRLRGGGPVGSMLSGGLDSSAIATVAADLLKAQGQAPLTTFSALFGEQSGANERPYMDSVLRRGSFDPVFVPIEEHATFGSFGAILAEQESAFLAPNLGLGRKVYGAAAARGFKVILDGHGGDEVVSHGEGLFQDLAKAGRWRSLWRELQAYSDSLGARPEILFLSFLNLHRPGLLTTGMTRLAHRVHHSARRRARQTPGRSFVDRFMNPRFASRMSVEDRVRNHRRLQHQASKSEASLHYWNLSGPLSAYAFEVLDKSAAGAGIEARYPFWDKRLVEFCLSLPSGEKLAGGWSRMILRRAMNGILPPSVQWRRDKIDFYDHFVGGMTGPHQHFVDGVLRPGASGADEYVNLPEIAAVFERMKTDARQVTREEVQAVWRTVSLALWLRRLDGTEAAA